MPRENQTPKFIEKLLASDTLSQGNEVSVEAEAEEDDQSWELTFLEMGINPMELGELKLTRQHGMHFDDDESLTSEVDL